MFKVLQFQRMAWMQCLVPCNISGPMNLTSEIFQDILLTLNCVNRMMENFRSLTIKCLKPPHVGLFQPPFWTEFLKLSDLKVKNKLHVEIF